MFCHVFGDLAVKVTAAHMEVLELMYLYRVSQVLPVMVSWIVLHRMSIIIRQLRDWLKGASGGETETTGNKKKPNKISFWQSWNLSGTWEHVRKMLLHWYCIMLLNQKKKTDSEPRRQTFEFASVFYAGLQIVFSVTGREQPKPDLGVALPMQMRIFLPDYTCLVRSWVFILSCFNPNWCGTDFAFSFTAYSGSRYYPVTTTPLNEHWQQL